MSEATDGDGRLPGIRRSLIDFATAYGELGLYRRICEAAATDDDVAGLLTVAPAGQARAVLLLAALHDLVLRRPDLPVARWYPSVPGGPVPVGDPWPDVRDAALGHAPELRRIIAARSTQTNEVNRAVYLAPLLARAGVDLPGVPVALVELGSSAGLLLGLDRYRIELRPGTGRHDHRDGGPSVADGGGRCSTVPDRSDPVGAVLGDAASPVVCAGEVRGGFEAVRSLALPPVAERVGLDRSPVDLADVDSVRWLEACLWPDVPGRLERFRAAVALARGDGRPPWTSVAGDMVDDLVAVGDRARAAARSDLGTEGPVHLVVMCSWALTYVARDRRPRVAEALAELAADGSPVSWLTAEPPGCVPGLPPVDDDGTPGGVTVLGARRWREGGEVPPVVWGLAHPHGEWLAWEGSDDLPVLSR